MNTLQNLSSIFIGSFLCLLLACSNNPQQKNTQTGERTKVEQNFIFKERKQYFMKLENAKQIRAVFEYCNNTDEVLLIETVKTHCGCTAVDYPRKPIKPNEKGEVVMTVDLPEQDGYFSQVAGVHFKGKTPIVLKVMGKNIHTHK